MNVIAANDQSLAGADILVSAGIQFTASVEEFPTANWDEFLAIKLSAAFHTTAAVLPHIRQQGWGRVFRFIANGLWTTDEVISRLNKKV